MMPVRPPRAPLVDGWRGEIFEDVQNWQDPPDHPKLGLDDAHVWRVVIADFASDAPRLASVLSADEAARAARFIWEIDRRRFIVTRAFLRMILSRYLARPVDRIEFCYGTHGKPSLADNPGEITFNVSHSRDLALYAVAVGHDLGVDVEHVKRDVDFLVIVDRFFSAAECAAFHAVPANLQREAFFRGWVRKESYIKARGEGLSIPLHSFDFTVFPEPPILLRAGGDPDEPGRWSFREFVPRVDHVAELATEGPVERVTYYNSG